MQFIKSFLMGIAMIGYLVLGLVQLCAIYSFFSDYCGWWFIFSSPASLFVAYIPFVGPIVGIIAAHSIWNWSVFGSMMLFCWPYFLYIPALMIGGAAEAINSIQNRKAS